MTEETKLMPCPFCGSEVAQLNTNQFHCENAACVLAGFPICSTAGHARRLWNKRAISPPEPTEGDLLLHDQKGDAVDTRYSVQTPEGGILFLFNECGITAREVFETFKAGRALRAMPLQDHAEGK